MVDALSMIVSGICFIDFGVHVLEMEGCDGEVQIGTWKSRGGHVIVT